MPLDAPDFSSSVLATLHYLVGGDKKPEFYVGNLPPKFSTLTPSTDPAGFSGRIYANVVV